MKTTPIAAADIVCDADGTPRSARYDDVYHPRSGALAQARHVFLDGAGLASRWRGRDRFVVLETGFGLGNNFLATWSAWHDDPERCRQLHYLSIEQSPPTAATLGALARDAALAPYAAELARRWPPLTCNLHRLVLGDGGVELLLAFGDVAAWLPQLVAEVDAFFLDGFAPSRNPQMWDARLFKAMARLAGADATVATWSAARAVRDGLRSAGFVVEKTPGSGGKREITRGRFAPRFQPRPSPRRPQPARSPAVAGARANAADVIIVGAGLAGCALAHALAARGARSLVLERGSTVAAEGSGNAAGLFHGVVHGDDGRHARFHRAAALAAATAVKEAVARHRVRGSAAGLLRVELTLELEAMRALLAAHGLPPDYVQAVDRAAASRLAGVPIASAAWHYPGAGWVDPGGLARSWLADAGERAELRFRFDVASLRRTAGCWQVCGEDGTTLASAPVVALCNGDGALARASAAPWPIRRQRGQLSVAAAAEVDAPHLPIAGAGYVLPVIDEAVWFGASSSWHDDATLRCEDQQLNVARLTALLGLGTQPALAGLRGRVGFRWLSEDRLPIIGAVPAALAEGAIAGFTGAPTTRFDQPRLVARAAGLFVCCALGSRGIASSAFGAQLLAASITGAPVPGEADLLDAVDPARFMSRDFRRGEAARRLPLARGDQPPVGPMAGSAGA